MNSVGDILRGHIAAMQKINQDGLAHVQEVSQSQIRMLERYVAEPDRMADELIVPRTAETDAQPSPA